MSDTLDCIKLKEIFEYILNSQNSYQIFEVFHCTNPDHSVKSSQKLRYILTLRSVSAIEPVQDD